VPSRVHCPRCAADFAYSPALLGRSYRCQHCEHPFTVSAPPVEELPVARFADLEVGVRALNPPPLPPRRPAHDGNERPRRRVVHRDRPSGTATLIGLLAAFLVGFLILAAGVGYVLWPGASRSTAPSTQGPARPSVVDTPTAGDRPKPLDEVMRQAPQRESGPAMPVPLPAGELRPQPPGAFPPRPPGMIGPPPGAFGRPGMPGQPGPIMRQPLFPIPHFSQARGTNAAVFPPACLPAQSATGLAEAGYVGSTLS
jgi:hypothetical protein